MTHLEEPWYTPTLKVFLLEDVPRLMGISPSALERDVHTIAHRLATEGESFLTKTLPALGKAIDRALQGEVPLITRHFKKRSKRDARPAFLQALLKHVFEEDGYLAVNPSPLAIRLVRQVCLWMKKLEKGFTDESLRRALEDFIQVDSALPLWHDLPRDGALGTARAIIEAAIGRSPKLHSFTPRHGPGAVAEKGLGVGKRSLGTCYTALERLFRPVPYFLSLRDISEDPSRVYNRPKMDFGLSRLEFVEKDSSGPRTIGLEPAEYMWCQQAVKGWLYNHIETHRLTRGRVNFTDQSVNQRFTADWSAYDTLDMSKASDRNSYALVKALFEKTWIWPYLDACRTPGTVLPNGKTLFYRKFAPMGSAVCFPVQALVYFALACAILHRQGMPLSIALNNVYVYGDDLIVPHGYFTHIDAGFSRYGLKFNADKCCVAGKFRESCGVDAFDGINVTPIRLKRAYPRYGRQDLIPLVKHANNLWRAGYRSAARALRLATEGLTDKVPPNVAVGGTRPRFPQLPQSSRLDLPFLYWLSDEPSTVRYRHHNGVCTVRGWGFSPSEEKGLQSDEMKYLRESLLHGGPVGHLPRNTRPGFWSRTYDCDNVVQRCPKRTFDKRYAGTLRRKRYVVASPVAYCATSTAAPSDLSSIEQAEMFASLWKALSGGRRMFEHWRLMRKA